MRCWEGEEEVEKEVVEEEVEEEMEQEVGEDVRRGGKKGSGWREQNVVSLSWVDFYLIVLQAGSRPACLLCACLAVWLSVCLCLSI